MSGYEGFTGIVHSVKYAEAYSPHPEQHHVSFERQTYTTTCVIRIKEDKNIRRYKIEFFINNLVFYFPKSNSF